MTFFQLGRSVHFDEGSGREGGPLVMTSEAGWAETDLSVLTSEGDQTVKLDEGVDQPGPVSLAVAARDTEAGGRLVVFGDSDFATNQYFGVQGNGDLALNALSWLAEDEALISIRPREPGHNPIALTESDSEWIFWLSVVLYPGLIALVGIVVVSRKGRWSLADLSAAGLGIVISLGIAALVNFPRRPLPPPQRHDGRCAVYAVGRYSPAARAAGRQRPVRQRQDVHGRDGEHAL